MLFLIPAVQESMPERSRLRLRPSTRATSTSHKSIQKFFFRPSSFSGQFFCRYTSCPPVAAASEVSTNRVDPTVHTVPRTGRLKVFSTTLLATCVAACSQPYMLFFFFLIIQTSDNSCRPGQSSPSALPPVVVGALRHPLSLDRAVAGATGSYKKISTPMQPSVCVCPPRRRRGPETRPYPS